MLINLSAAFDTVDHEILLRRLDTSYGITGNAHKWFQSYLFNRKQFVRLGLSKSSIIHLLCGIPQGSVRGSLLFVLYMADLIHLIEQLGLQAHMYADDTQVLGLCLPRDVIMLQSRLSACLDDVALWMRSNRLQLNTNKTELLWCTTARRQSQLPCTSLRVGSTMVSPTSSVRYLDFYIDADSSGRTQIIKTIASCCDNFAECVDRCLYQRTSSSL